MNKVLPKEDDDISLEIKMSCKASKPDPNIKKEVWGQLTTGQGISKAQLTALMGSFYQNGQEGILSPFYDEYYNILLD